MKRDYADYLSDIVDSISAIEQFVADMDLEEFRKDLKTVYAVIRAFEVLGEAAKKIPQELRQQHSSVPWKEMAGMRDKLIREYFSVDPEALWKTIEEDLPTLKQSLKELADR
jgi:uncharacterized protein with HEPN domain